jgi:UMF1 family MFS transporter
MESAGADWDRGSQIFKYLTSGLALTVAILSPVIGAASNYKGRKSKFFKLFLILGLAGGFALAIPGLDWLVLLIIFAIASLGYNLTNVVYDAFLVDVTTADRMDEISALGFAMGYIGSMVPFFIGIIPYALVSLGILDEDLGHYAISFAFLVAVVWWLVYSLPILRDVEQKREIEGDGSLKEALKRLNQTFRQIRGYKNIFLFMLAYLLYIDVVNTVIRLAINIGGDLYIDDIILLGVIVVVQLIAFPCAIIFGRLTKVYGPKKMIYYGIFIYAVTIFVVYSIEPGKEYYMWFVAVLVGTAQGGIQSVSRSFFVKLIPIEKANDFFGFFSVFGRFGGIISPFLIAFYQVKIGINLAVLLLLIPLGLGALLFAFVKDEKSELIV